MPGWQETLNKTGQDLVRGNYFGDRNSKRVASWKKSLDETGQGLLHGLGKKKKTTDDFAQPLNVPHPQKALSDGRRLGGMIRLLVGNDQGFQDLLSPTSRPRRCMEFHVSSYPFRQNKVGHRKRHCSTA